MSDANQILKDEVSAIFVRLGEAVAARVPTAQWHVEFPASHVYDLVAMLVFTLGSDPTVEQAVLAVEFRRSPDVSWKIDLTDRESMPLMEVTDLPSDLQRGMAENATLATTVIADRLRRSEDLIVRELNPYLI